MKNFRSIVVLAMVVALVACLASAQEPSSAPSSTPTTPNPNCPIQRTKNFINGMMDRMRTMPNSAMSNTPSGEY